jgi:hypothetical protein
MNARRYITALLAILAALAGGRADDAPAKPAVAAPAPVPAPAVRATSTGPVTDLAAFRIIEERNIFNPNRVGRTVAGTDTPGPQNDTITLVGTMHYEKGLFAFFAGSSPTYQKALHEGELIAQYTVTRIAKDSVDLTRDGQKLTLAIGQALQRPPGGDWTVTTPVVAVAPAPEASRPADQPASASPAVAADASETLKRLMEKRQQQLKP